MSGRRFTRSRGGPTLGRGRGSPGMAKITNAKKENNSPDKNFTRSHDYRKAKDRFGKGDVMPSGQHQVETRRQTDIQLSEVDYCRPPPKGIALVHLRLVFPGEHLVPKALDDIRIFDDIRRSQRVWITREEETETSLEIYAFTATALQNGLRVVNNMIHILRRSDESLTALYFVQPPLPANYEVPIAFETGKRPIMKDGRVCFGSPLHALSVLRPQFSGLLPQSFKTLVALPCLKMQITFGNLNIVTKRKKTPSLLSVGEYVAALGQYSSRGRGAFLQTELPNIDFADSFLSLALGDEEIVPKGTKVSLRHHVEFIAGRKTVSADIKQDDGVINARSPTWTEMDRCPPLDWIISAPDMSVDWNLRVDSHKIGEVMPEAIAELAESFAFRFESRKDNKSNSEANLLAQYFTLPKWQSSSRGGLAQTLTNIQVKSSARVQFRDTPYEIEVTIAQQWAKIPTSAEPDRLSWSITVSGINWDEALNERKDGAAEAGFGEDLSLLWPGGGCLEQQLQGVLECVLSIQTLATKLMC